jgi:hypothetical protein
VSEGYEREDTREIERERVRKREREKERERERERKREREKEKERAREREREIPEQFEHSRYLSQRERYRSNVSLRERDTGAT